MFARKHSKTILAAMAVTTIGLLAGGVAMHSLLAALAGTTMHVDAVIVNFRLVGGPNRQPTAHVWIRDEFGDPVNGALVTGDWSGSNSCDFIFPVTSVTKDGMTYNPTANLETATGRAASELSSGPSTPTATT